jgi:Na+-translocating ferredoxin:NAD+ oxidoreductase subunit G
MATPVDASVAAGTRRYIVLAVVLVGVILTVWAIAAHVQERIEANHRAWFVARLNSLIPDTMRDNDLYGDAILVTAPAQLGREGSTAIYRARLLNRPTGAILSVTAPDGYGGPIELLVAVDYSGSLIGVDILRHNETPGIGDTFEPHRSDWLKSLHGRSLDNTDVKQWTIGKDGGVFDQFTGASVTPRAILKSVRRALEYFATHRDAIFQTTAPQ